MKVEALENHIQIYAENQKEQSLLDALYSYGARVFGKSTNTIVITSPHEAGLRQLFINREQQAILSYALAKVEFENKLMGLISGDFVATAHMISQAVTNISDLKDQLFFAPEPITTSVTAPRARVIAPMPTIPTHTAAIKPERNLFKIQGQIETDLPLERWNKDFVAWTTTRGEKFGGQITPIRQKPKITEKKEES